MIFSQQAMFSDKQAFTATAVSDNSIDLGERSTIPSTGVAQTADIGAGRKIPLGIHVTTAFAGLTSVQVQLLQSDTIDGSGDLTSSEIVAVSPVVPLADLVAGYTFNMDSIPTHTTKRYIQLNYVVVGTGSAGAIMSGITAGNEEGAI